LRDARFRPERAWVTGPDAFGLPTRGWVAVEPGAVTYEPYGALAKTVGNLASFTRHPISSACARGFFRA
jgi:hypothetical protein